MREEQPVLPGGPRSIYFPPPPPHEQAQRAKRELADAVRGLIDEVVVLDGSRATVDGLVAARLAVDEARAAVGSLPSLRELRRADWPGIEQAQVERGPSSGRANPLASPLHLEQVGDVTRGWAVFGQAYEGGVGDMHGGVMAAAFDDVLGCAQMAGEVIGRTGTLTVRYRSPSPIGQRIDFEARIDRVEGRKVFVTGTARAGDVLVAEAEGIFVMARSAS